MAIPSPIEGVPKELHRGVCAANSWGVAGEIAEFGTMTGATALALAVSINFVDQTNYGRTRRDTPPRALHLFDSFEGLPAPAEGDLGSPMVNNGGWGLGTHKGLSAVELTNSCARALARDRIRTFEGWFSNTIPTIPEGTRYALVHVDSDLYSSAWDVLDGLFGRKLIAEGCQLFFDDWNCNFASPNYGERRAWREAVAKYNIEWSDFYDYGLVSHRLLVHSYG